MRPPATSIVPIVLEVAPPDIALIKFLFESYEEIGIVRTLDRRRALIVILVVPDFVEDAEALVHEAVTVYGAKRVEAPTHSTEDWLLADLAAEA